ncbi:MAG: DUF4040 domain-containing protein, partial [Desulfobacteraceae bacterium]|nr:DUF4040 domain-containing protein [Desulfobacteraceae bacterium]
GTVTQSYRISELPVYADVLRSHSLYPAVLVCVFLAAFTKSAQFPFHFWLPNAMAAPTPVSAFLHSATMVKAGIYLLARMHPVLGGTGGWMATLVIVGSVTALLGSIEAMGQKDMKRVLAYTTLMALGILTMFLGGKTTPALTAAATFLLVHSLYKSGLFLVVGIIDHETGTRELGRVGGLLPLMPRTAFGAATAAMSMAGFPLFLGFIGKEIMYKGALTEEMFPAFATTAAVLSNALMTAVAGILLIRPFLGGAHQTPRPAHEPPLGMWLGPAILGGIGLGFGLIPGWVSRWLVEPAVRSFHPGMEAIQLKLWHGFNEPLLLSVLTLTMGTGFYLIRRPLRQGMEALLSKLPAKGDRAYDAAMAATAATAHWQTRMLQSGSLHRYLYTIIAVFSVTTAVVWFGKDPHWEFAFRPSLSGSQWLLSLLMLAAVVVVLRSHSRLLSVCALGIVGAGSALIFLTNGAPDLALTQLLVETLTVIIVAIVLLRLPLLTASPDRPPRRRLLDGALSAAAGILTMLLVLAVTAGDPDTTLNAFYEAQSLPGGHGRNIVNVILVDFRSLDTLGEIVVVATAGLAGYGLIRSRRKEE